MKLGYSDDEKMKLVDKFDHCYVSRFAWLPIRVQEGHRVWLSEYFIYFSKHSHCKLAACYYEKIPAHRRKQNMRLMEFIDWGQNKRMLKKAISFFKAPHEQREGHHKFKVCDL